MMRPMQTEKSFTGKRMAIIMILFFGVIISVNFTMARFAIAGFSGTVVDNSYVASQNFNTWLHAAETQDALNWKVQIKRDNQDYLIAQVDFTDQGLADTIISADLARPLGEKDAQTIALRPDANGLYRSEKPMAKGRWLVQLQINHNDKNGYFQADLP